MGDELLRHNQYQLLTNPNLFHTVNNELHTFQKLLNLHKEIDPGFNKNGFVEKSADAFRLLIEKDGRDIQLVEKILHWCKQPDNFWASVIRSGSGFRKNFDAIYPQWKQFCAKEEAELLKQGYTLEEDLPL